MKTSFGAFFLVLAAIFVVSVHSAQAAERMPPILVSVGDLSPGKNTQWRKETCALIHKIANSEVQGGMKITCRSFDALQLMDTYVQQLKKDNLYHLRLLRGYRGVIKISITSWSDDADSDPTNGAWSVRGDASTSDLQKILQDFFHYVDQELSTLPHSPRNLKTTGPLIYLF